MATRYPSSAVRALGQRGNAMANAFGRRVKPPRRQAPKAPKQTRGGYTSPRKPLLGPDTVDVMPERPSAGQSVDYGNTPAFSGGGGGYDVGSDPAVARMAALSGRMRAEAQATAAAKRKQAAIEFGDPTGVEGLDEATIKASKENPFSILAALQRSYDVGVRDLEEGLNKGNLFYSGYRGQQLGEAATGLQQQRSDAGTRFQGLMTDINDQLAAALLNADMMDADAAMSSDDGYYDPGSYYEEDPWEEYEDDQMDAATLGKPKPKQKAKPKGKTVKVAGKNVPLAQAKKQLNRAISEAKVRASKPKPKPKPKPAPKKKPAPKRSGR